MSRAARVVAEKYCSLGGGLGGMELSLKLFGGLGSFLPQAVSLRVMVDFDDVSVCFAKTLVDVRAVFLCS